MTGRKRDGKGYYSLSAYMRLSGRRGEMGSITRGFVDLWAVHSIVAQIVPSVESSVDLLMC